MFVAVSCYHDVRFVYLEDHPVSVIGDYVYSTLDSGSDEAGWCFLSTLVPCLRIDVHSISKMLQSLLNFKHWIFFREHPYIIITYLEDL